MRRESLGKKREKMKYHNRKTIFDGIAFDSKKEAVRYAQLKLLEKGGIISGLELQKEFELVPAQYEVSRSPTGKEKKRCIERAVKYRADFSYYDNEKKKTVVEDVKGMRTKEYIIKKKLMLWLKGIKIEEI